ncbi:MAG: acyltransferase [Caldilinea sp. CFX5]|nr:acyltransferase [Caldilinea sp. CFX5]
MKKNALPALTSLRFLAAMAIIAFHFSINNAAMIPPFLYAIIKHGNMAVNFFFVLSGFVLAYTYLDKPVEPRRFWLARFARVYPVYLLALLLSIPAYLTTIDLGSGSGFVAAITTLFTELTLVQAWAPLYGCGINCPGWSISAEAFFYLLFPLVGVYLAKLRTRSLLLMTLLLWVVAIAVNTPLWLTYAAMTDGAMKRMVGDFIAFNPLLNLSAFIVGIATGIIFLRQNYMNPDNALSHRVTGVEIGSLLLALSVIAYSGIPHALLRTGIASPLFAAVIYALALGKGGIAKLLAHPLLLILGEASYAIYILQVPISYWTRQLIAVTPLQDFSAIAYPALYLPIIIGFSIGSFFWLEKPLRRKIIAFFQQEAKRSTPLDKQGVPNQATGYVNVAS